MRLRDLKDALQGAQSKNERYEEALRAILMACEVARPIACDNKVHYSEAIAIIEEICTKHLTKH